MIKRINTLKRVGRFLDFASARGDEGNFAELNVIFASNAAGKSTLCDVFRSMATGNGAYVLGRKRFGTDGDPEIVVTVAGVDPPNTIRFQEGSWRNQGVCPPIHVYDDRFVAENVLVGHHINVGQRRNLYGLAIGPQAVALKAAVDSAEQDLARATSTFNAARGALISLVPDGQELEEFRGLPVVPNVDEEIETATAQLATATQSRLKVVAIRSRPNLVPVPIPGVPARIQEVLASTLDDAAIAAEARINEHLAQTSQGLSTEWIGQGHRAQLGEDCPHCGQGMAGLEILRAYRAFFSGELQAQERIRTEVEEKVGQRFGEVARDRLRREIGAHEIEQTWWNDAVAYRLEMPRLRDREVMCVALENAHAAMSSALSRKRASPGTAITTTVEENEALQCWGEVSAELAAYNEGLSVLNEALDLRKEEAGNIELAPYQDRLDRLRNSKLRHEPATVDAFEAFDTSSEAKLAAQQVKQAANEALREQSNELLRAYGARINELLHGFSADFRIVASGVNFRGGPPSGDLAIEILNTQVATAAADAANPGRPSLANTLSGGDRSALALAYFLATVESDPNLASCVLVFDDPYHNQDRSRRQFTLERIAAVAQNARQCFILSHDLEFARAVENSPRTFEIKPLGDQVTLEPKELPLLPSRAYEKNYICLSTYIAAPQDHLDRLRAVANTLRVILEEYFRLKFPTRWAENDWLGDMIGKIREAETGDPLLNCSNLVDELSAINDYCKRFHHGATGGQADEPEPRELKVFAERTLVVIHT